MNVTYLVNILHELKHFTQSELSEIEESVSKKNIFISVKKLTSLVEMAVQTSPSVRVSKFISLLDEQCGIPY